jgi:hypothetical protein
MNLSEQFAASTQTHEMGKSTKRVSSRTNLHSPSTAQAPNPFADLTLRQLRAAAIPLAFYRFGAWRRYLERQSPLRFEDSVPSYVRPRVFHIPNHRIFFP